MNPVVIHRSGVRSLTAKERVTVVKTPSPPPASSLCTPFKAYGTVAFFSESSKTSPNVCGQSLCDKDRNEEGTLIGGSVRGLAQKHVRGLGGRRRELASLHLNIMSQQNVVTTTTTRCCGGDEGIDCCVFKKPVYSPLPSIKAYSEEEDEPREKPDEERKRADKNKNGGDELSTKLRNLQIRLAQFEQRLTSDEPSCEKTSKNCFHYQSKKTVECPTAKLMHAVGECRRKKVDESNRLRVELFQKRLEEILGVSQSIVMMRFSALEELGKEKFSGHEMPCQVLAYLAALQQLTLRRNLRTDSSVILMESWRAVLEKFGKLSHKTVEDLIADAARNSQSLSFFKAIALTLDECVS